MPGGNVGMWIVGCIGLLGTLFALFIAFFPPEELAAGNVVMYETILVLVSLILAAMPFIIYQFRRPDWLPISSAGEEEQ